MKERGGGGQWRNGTGQVHRAIDQELDYNASALGEVDHMTITIKF